MDRKTLLWTLVAFFGASIAFAAIRNATEGESALVTLGLEVLALVAIVGLTMVAQKPREARRHAP